MNDNILVRCFTPTYNNNPSGWVYLESIEDTLTRMQTAEVLSVKST